MLTSRFGGGKVVDAIDCEGYCLTKGPVGKIQLGGDVSLQNGATRTVDLYPEVLAQIGSLEQHEDAGQHMLHDINAQLYEIE